jgi:hypothetical protein
MDLNPKNSRRLGILPIVILEMNWCDKNGGLGKQIFVYNNKM